VKRLAARALSTAARREPAGPCLEMQPALESNAEGSICSKRSWSPSLTRPKDLPRGCWQGFSRLRHCIAKGS